MYKTEYCSKYYLIDLYKGAQVREFHNEESLIDWLVYQTREVFIWWDKEKIKNTYLDEIALSTNDMMESVDFKTLDFTVCHRRYMFYDDHNRIIDARIYWPEVKARFIRRKEHKYDHRVSDDARPGDIYHRYSWARGNEYKYAFRRGPVPGTSYHWRGYWYRHPHTTAEYKQNTDPDYKQYVRAKRRHLPNAYDDICRSDVYSRNWKDNTKKRKQWM